ncbi:MAG: gluconate 2-dehydrogenase subunit 3 family protein [Dehalococcoidia bacterium]|nr:gluconate 2-dehydrogenase subunit 3 family protein [Dehalococcoidia bacterium]
MPRFLSETQYELVSAVLDRLIPPHGDMPGAGEVGTADYIDGIAGGSAHIARLFADGLQDIEIAAGRSGSSFHELSAEQQDSILRAAENDSPGFFDALIRHTYNGYYSNPKIVELLGLDPRPPQPRGNRVERGDLSSLEVVVDRGQAYRDA